MRITNTTTTTLLLFLGFTTTASAFALRMMASGGAPAYDKRPAVLVSNQEVGRASYLLRLKSTDGAALAYEPGNVLALEMYDESKDDWVVGPYTVSRCDAKAHTLDICYRVVGDKTELFRRAQPHNNENGNDQPVVGGFRFGGIFKVPIYQGIMENKGEQAQNVLGLSTGVGIGPLLGFAEQALSNQEFRGRIDLCTLYREEEDVAFRTELGELTRRYEDRFSWTTVLSHERTVTVLPPSLMARYHNIADTTTHVHLIGNGSMVNEWMAGLETAGVSPDRLTKEIYFNHKVKPRQDVVDAIGEAMRVVVTGDPVLK